MTIETKKIKISDKYIIEEVFGLNPTLTFQLGLIYELIKDGLVERVEYEE